MTRTFRLRYLGMSALIAGFAFLCQEEAPANNIHVTNQFVLVNNQKNAPNGACKAQELLRMQMQQQLVNQIGRDCACGQKKDGKNKGQVAKGGGGKGKGGQDLVQGINQGKGAKGGGGKGKGGQDLVQGINQGKGAKGGGGKGKGGQDKGKKGGQELVQGFNPQMPCLPLNPLQQLQRPNNNPLQQMIGKKQPNGMHPLQQPVGHPPIGLQQMVGKKQPHGMNPLQQPIRNPILGPCDPQMMNAGAMVGARGAQMKHRPQAKQ